jgi:hypothetical protein
VRALGCAEAAAVADAIQLGDNCPVRLKRCANCLAIPKTAGDALVLPGPNLPSNPKCAMLVRGLADSATADVVATEVLSESKNNNAGTANKRKAIPMYAALQVSLYTIAQCIHHGMQ